MTAAAVAPRHPVPATRLRDAGAFGADMVNVGREAMLAIGCIQAQRCHAGRCPTGVATQSRWLMHGLYEPGWPRVSDARRAQIESFVGEEAPIAPPGPQAGPVPGDDSAPRDADEKTREHVDAQGLGEPAREAG